MLLKEIAEVFKVDPASIRYHIKQQHCNPTKERVNGRATWVFSEKDVENLKNYISKPESTERRRSVEDRLSALEEVVLSNSIITDGLVQSWTLQSILIRKLFALGGVDPVVGFRHNCEQAEKECSEILPDTRQKIYDYVDTVKKQFNEK